VYTVLSRVGEPDPALLRSLPRELPPGGAVYVQTPEQLDERIAQLADSITAGASSDYERVRAIETWLRTGFDYTLELPRTAREATLENFLFRRRAGHCEYFSTALAVMLRTLGIPARNVNGFLGGEWNGFGSYLTVTQNQAHSWVEVWFPAAGWVAFDPTPAAEGDAAAGAGAGLSPFRFLLDGFEHRWNKWVLDYDLERQVELVRGMAAAFSRDAAPNPAAGGAATGYRVLLITALVVATAFALRRQVWPGRRLSSEAGPYVALRCAYEREGLIRANLPPLAFRDALASVGAPGHHAADGAVALYVQARFGGRTLDEDERSALRAYVRTARAELRKARGRFPRFRRRPADPS
ncbi:MAG: transglutaminase-like domain-containing protein, partial [Longimicrobiales bacterium]